MKRVLAMALCLVMVISLLATGVSAQEPIAATDLLEGALLELPVAELPSEEEAVPEEAPVEESPAEESPEESPEEISVPEMQLPAEDFLVAIPVEDEMPAEIPVFEEEPELDGGGGTGGRCGDDAIYTIEDNVLTISGNGWMDHYAGPSDAPWSTSGHVITKLVVEEGITHITTYSFTSLTELEEVSLPASLENVGEDAFRDAVDMDPEKFTYGGTMEQWLTLCESIGPGNRYLLAMIQPEGKCGDNLSWSLSPCDDHGNYMLVITGTGDMYSYEWKTLPWRGFVKYITSVVIQPGVTSIGAMAFYSFSAINGISIPSTVTEIEYYSLAVNTNLPSVTVPESVKTIGEGAFYMGWDEIVVETRDAEIFSEKAYALGGPDYTVLKGYRNSTVQTYAETFGYKFEPLDYVPGGVLAEGTCGEGVNWKIQDGVLIISGDGYMADYTPLARPPWYSYRGEFTQVRVLGGVKSVGNYALYGNEDITSVSLGADIEGVGEGAFQGCSVLETINFPEGMQIIDKNAFRGAALKSVTLPESLVIIGSHAFRACHSLETLDLGGTQYIFDYAFYQCGVLENFTFPGGLLAIGDYAFDKCYCLTELTIPRSVESIGLNVFRNLTYEYYVEDASVEELLIRYDYDGNYETWQDICYEYGARMGLSDNDIQAMMLNPPRYEAVSTMEKITVLSPYCSINYGTEGEDAYGENNLGAPNSTALYGVNGSTTHYYAIAFGYSFNETVGWKSGDVDGNGTVNTADAMEILKYTVGMPSVFGSCDAETESMRRTAADLAAAYGVIDARDATQLMRQISGLGSVYG